MKNYKIAVAGTGYVGLSLGVLLSQHHQVVAVDIVQAKVDMINNKKSPIQDDYNPSMNYLYHRTFLCPVPYVHKVGIRGKNQKFPRLRKV